MNRVPVPAENCSSVKDYFEKGGKIELPRPAECTYEYCKLKQPLRKNGGYYRAIVYWGFAFFVYVSRFRCRRCGRTASCPYTWMIPYCRFPAELVALGVELYCDLSKETSYRDVSTELSDLNFITSELDIRETELYRELQSGKETEVRSLRCGNAESESGRAALNSEPTQRPLHTTVWTWLSKMCDRSEEVLQQIQKELVREWKRKGCSPCLPPAVVNANSWKAWTVKKANQLDLLVLAGRACIPLIEGTSQVWLSLRSYFFEKAETCQDLLTSLKSQM